MKTFTHLVEDMVDYATVGKDLKFRNDATVEAIHKLAELCRLKVVHILDDDWNVWTVKDSYQGIITRYGAKDSVSDREIMYRQGKWMK